MVGDPDAGDAARALLDPAEELRLTGNVQMPFGDSGPIADAEPVELPSLGWFDRFWGFCTRTTARKFVVYPLLAPLALFVFFDGLGPSGAFLDRLVGGRTCQGPRGSLARRAEQAMGPGMLGGGSADRYAASDRRLVLVRSRRSFRSTDPEEVLSLPLADIASARRRPRGIMRRRAELSFVDGSRIVLALPLLASGGDQAFNPSPKRFIASLQR